jgi:GNAT superfamily N-acetyltransferase
MVERKSLPLETTFGVIREARLSDAADIVEMVGMLSTHHGDTTTLTTDILVREAFGATPWIHLLVAEVQGQVAGYAAMFGLVRLHFGTRGFDLHHLFVKSDHRSHGIGVALIDACKIKAREHSGDYLLVSTTPDNLKAQAFYVVHGFERQQTYPPKFMLQVEA